LLDGFKDDVEDQAEAADGRQWRYAAVPGGSGIAERGFHFGDFGGAGFGEEGEVGKVTETVGQESNQAVLAGGIEDFIAGDGCAGRVRDDLANKGGQAGVGT
jgi:hypothetical protein